MRLKVALVLALVVFCAAFLLLGYGGIALVAQEIAAASDTPVPEATSPPEPEGGEEGESGLADTAASRTPAPTVTPGVLDEAVTELTEATGLAGETFLGLKAEDWINLGFSLLFVIAGYFLGQLIISNLLKRLARRTETEFDDLFLEAIGPQVRWAVLLLFLHFSTIRLTFLSADVKALLKDVYFTLGMAVGISITRKLLGFAVEWYRTRIMAEPDSQRLDPVVTLMHRVSQLFVILIATTIMLSHFGVNITAFAASLGIAGLAFSLAAQDTLADAISGFIILVDQPYRVGDRSEIAGLDTWGDVVQIGVRTTRIRTRDNRMVIVPNSNIGKNQVVNYTYPDPQYRVQIDLGLAYGTDIEYARRVLVETVEKVPGILEDKPVEALYLEMAPSAMMFRVRWWIESYEDLRRIFDRVNTALQHALDQAGIESPFPTQDLNVKIDSSGDGAGLELPGSGSE